MQWIWIGKTNIPEYYHTIGWIEIYPLDSIIQCLKNWGLKKSIWFHCSTQPSDEPSGMLVMSIKVPNGTKSVPRKSFYERWIQCFLLIQKKENELLELSVLPSNAKDGASLAVVVFKLTDQTFLVQKIEHLSQSESVSLTQWVWACCGMKNEVGKRRIVWFQKISIPPPQKGFFLRPPPPTPLEIPVKLHTFTQMFGPLRTPHPQGISNPFCGGSMDVSGTTH